MAASGSSLLSASDPWVPCVSVARGRRGCVGSAFFPLWTARARVGPSPPPPSPLGPPCAPLLWFFCFVLPPPSSLRFRPESSPSAAPPEPGVCDVSLLCFSQKLRLPLLPVLRAGFQPLALFKDSREYTGLVVGGRGLWVFLLSVRPAAAWEKLFAGTLGSSRP